MAKQIGVGRDWVTWVERGNAGAEIGLVLKALHALGLDLDVRTAAASMTPLADGSEPWAPDLVEILARAWGPGGERFPAPPRVRSAGRASGVVGPARDGGYYLLGLRGMVAGIFDGTEGSTPEVLRTTLERFGAAGVELEVLADVDTVDDLPPGWLQAASSDGTDC